MKKKKNTTKCTKCAKHPLKSVTSCYARGMFGHRRVTSPSLHVPEPRSCARYIIQGATFIILGLQCVGHNIHLVGF